MLVMDNRQLPLVVLSASRRKDCIASPTVTNGWLLRDQSMIEMTMILMMLAAITTPMIVRLN